MAMKCVFLYLFLFSSMFGYSQSSIADCRAWCGTWVMKNDKMHIVETWTCEKDKKMCGKSYEIQNGRDSILTETIKLIESNGNIFYTPTVSGQNQSKPVMFRMISNNKSEWVFENPSHDFPQKISYKLITNDSMEAVISGTDINGKERKVKFSYTRAL